MGGGRQVKFYPYKNGGVGAEQVLAMLKEGGGGAQQVSCSFNLCT